MIGRLFGLIVGAAVFVLGFGMWKPAIFSKYVDFAHVPLGPFGMYKSIVCGMIMGLGVVIALAALQRKGASKSTRPAAVVFADEPAHDHAPAPTPDDHAFKIDSHDDHGHAAPAHDDHGHGHDDHGHDAHGHAPAHSH